MLADKRATGDLPFLVQNEYDSFLFYHKLILMKDGLWKQQKLFERDVRQRFYQVPSLHDLLKTVKPEVILDFLRAAALYSIF